MCYEKSSQCCFSVVDIFSFDKEAQIYEGNCLLESLTVKFIQLKLGNDLAIFFEKKKKKTFSVEINVPGFELTFQKRFVSFSNKNNHKTDHRFCAPWSVDEENFEVHQICNLYQKTFIKKNCIKQLCKKSFKNKLCEISRTHRKGSSLLL